MTEKKIKNNMSSLGLTRGSRNGVESGRSMVEMLGVLAVVGVLSVGGIAGYTYAMNKHYANELLNGASQRAVVLKSQKAAGLDLSLREFDGVEVAGGEFSLNILEPDGAIGISVSKVKGAVCKNLIQATEGTDITIAKDDGILVSDITEEECDDDNLNNLVFVFETGLGSAGGNENNEGNVETYLSCNELQCIECPIGKEIVCNEEGSVCGCATNPEDTDSWACNRYSCISCPAGQTPHCSDYGYSENGCVCAPDGAVEGEDWACGRESCISCSDGQTPHCSDYSYSENGCVCLPDGVVEGEDWACGDYRCITCPAGQTPHCSDYGNNENGCVCVPDGAVEGEDWACNDYSCISCSDGKKAMCTDYDECVCVPKDSNSLCGPDMCITCPDGKTPICADDYDDYNTCVCVTDIDNEDSWECNSADCIDCPGGYAKCPTDKYGYGDCYCE